MATVDRRWPPLTDGPTTAPVRVPGQLAGHMTPLRFEYEVRALDVGTRGSFGGSGGSVLDWTPELTNDYSRSHVFEYEVRALDVGTRGSFGGSGGSVLDWTPELTNDYSRSHV
nr:hypothetical protein [Tanacetum cinerariifolium]